MGRPRKNPEATLSGELRIRVTESQRRLIDEAVAVEQGELSEWARAVLLQAARGVLARAERSKRRTAGPGPGSGQTG